MKIGISLGRAPDVVARTAAEAELAGIDSLWVAETSRTAFVSAAVAIQATSSITVGTSIALAFPRSPVITAMTARDLAELSNGRFVLGLGTQVKRVNEERYSTPFEHPAPKMREVIEVCREVWDAFDGKPLSHRGRFYNVTMPPFPGATSAGFIPIGVAGVNTRMVSLAGEVCDYFMGHPFTSVRYFTEVVRPALDAGHALRTIPGSCKVSQGAITSVASTTSEALRGAKYQIAFYGTTRTYSKLFEIHGWGHMTGALRSAFSKGDADAMIDCVTDEMAETYSLFGTPSEVKEKAKRWEGLVDELVAGPPWAESELHANDEIFSRLIETFS
ncbi:MAG: LLM class flavin-dependent oxidoreductase [Actinomycetota bacterium]